MDRLGNGEYHLFRSVELFCGVGPNLPRNVAILHLNPFLSDQILPRPFILVQ
jgi:hypothetical protein